ncbi:MAG TPA: type VI secretion system contractile sheath small subunit [Longimicrobium sp.]|nr:type VI secretion system contractile sheath small subunit [Longimicrobium sp.]
MNQDMQHWLGQNRPPRVQITYDVETLGATVAQEIPFIVGIIGDFVGGDQPDSQMADRTFVEIDRDNFDSVMAGLKPSLQLPSIPLFNVVRTPGGTGVQQGTGTTANPAPAFAPALTFASMDDFAPPSLIKQVPELDQLMQTRQTLSDLLAKLGTTPAMEATLAQQAAPLTLTVAPAALTAADTELKAATTLFTTAAAAVLKVETTDPNKTKVTAAQKAVTDAVGTATSGYTQALATATSATATVKDLQDASTALQAVVTALQAGVTVLQGVAATYNATTGTDDQKAAIPAVADADAAVDALVPAAWQVSLAGASAAALNSATAVLTPAAPAPPAPPPT